MIRSRTRVVQRAVALGIVPIGLIEYARH
jgi:hypothetical protein